jgi:hypothetical protein
VPVFPPFVFSEMKNRVLRSPTFVAVHDTRAARLA